MYGFMLKLNYKQITILKHISTVVFCSLYNLYNFRDHSTYNKESSSQSNRFSDMLLKLDRILSDHDLYRSVNNAKIFSQNLAFFYI